MAKSKISQFTPARNSAVELCRQAYDRAIEQSKTRNLDDFETDDEACNAFREAMPHLVTAIGIRDFIACATYGMIIRVFDHATCSKLLYAAQVAAGAFRNELKAQDPD